MLFVPYSSTIETIDCRIPVRIDATTIAVITPTTIPRMVRNDRNLCDRIESSAILRTSRGNDVVQRILALCQRNDRIELRRFPSGVESSDDADHAGDRYGQNDVTQCDRHRHSGEKSDQLSHTCRQRQTDDPADHAKERRLDQKLQTYLFLGRTHRLSYADLKSP